MSTTDTLLLNIQEQLGDMRQQIGSMLAKLEAGAEKHKAFERALEILDRRTDIIEDTVVEIDAVLKPKEGRPMLRRVESLEVFQGKLGAVIGGASVVVGTIFWFLWATVSWLWAHWTEIKSAVGRFFH